MSNVSTKSKIAPEKPVKLWNPMAGVVFAIAVFFLMQVVGGAILYIYPTLMGWSEQQITTWLQTATEATAAYLVITDVLIILAVLVFVRRYKTGLHAIGLRRPRFSDILYGFAAVIPYFIMYLLTVVLVSQLVPGLDVDQKQDLGFDNVSGRLELSLTFLCLVILAPLTEEILMRGLLYSSLRRVFSFLIAAIITSIIFGVAHLQGGVQGSVIYIAAIDTFVLSMVLVYLREKTGAVWASTVLHALKNCVAFVALFALHLR
jgi:uncharacterized protein